MDYETFKNWADENLEEFKTLAREYGYIPDNRRVPKQRVHRIDRQAFKKMVNDERAKDMKDMRLAGVSRVDIGKKYKISKERVNQILLEYYPDTVFPRTAMPRPAVFTKKCDREECEREYETYKFRPKKFCCNQCYFTVRGVYVKKDMTPEELKAYERDRHNAWYKIHKDDPDFKLQVKEWNEKAKFRRYLAGTQKPRPDKKDKKEFNPYREILKAYAKKNIKK